MVFKVEYEGLRVISKFLTEKLMDLTAIEKKDAVLAQQIILLSNFIANIWSKIMKIHENKFKQKISNTWLFRMTSFTAKTKLAETSKCSFISNRRTGEECGKMTVAKLRIGWSRDFLQNSRNSNRTIVRFHWKSKSFWYWSHVTPNLSWSKNWF